MASDLDPAAPFDMADLEAGPVGREGIGPVLIEELDGHQELRRGARPPIGIAHGLEPELVPPMRARLRDRVALIEIVDAVAEGIERLRQVPGEDAARVVRITQSCR